MSIFPTRILLATDGSADADLALSTAVDIVNSTNSELHVVTVGPGSPDPVYAAHESGFRYESYEEALEEVRQEAQRVLDEQVRKVEEAGAPSRRRTSRCKDRKTRRSSGSPRSWASA
jgi:nucleotide-binding universal stress UspA family protein